MPDIAGLVKGLLANDSFLTQIVLYNAVGQILEPLLAPYIQQLLNDTQSAHPDVPTSPAELAEMVIKNIKPEDQAALEAAMSGLTKERFADMVANQGEPPGLEQVLEWWRRGFLDWDTGGPGTASVVNAIRTSRIRNEWTETIRESQFLPITVADAVNAWVRGQIDETLALKYGYENGLKEPEMRILHNTTGRPPSPTELATFVRRGLIDLHGTGPDALTFQQGIYEGDLKNKWEPLFENLTVGYPSAFQVRNAQAAGSLTAEQALHLYKLMGYPDDVAQALVAGATGSKVTKAKNLAQSTITRLYVDQVITRDAAIAKLEHIGYDEEEAGYLLTVQDLHELEQQRSAALTNVRSHYLAGKLKKDAAVEILKAEGYSDDAVAQLFTVWDIEKRGQVKTLTAAQIVDAYYYEIVTEDWTLNALQEMGYSPIDAWLLLSIKLKGPQPGAPEGAPEPPPPPPPAPATPTGTTG